MDFAASAILLIMVLWSRRVFAVNRYIYVFACLWLLPSFGMFAFYSPQTYLNGLSTLIGVVMFALSVRGGADVLFWNPKERKIKKAAAIACYVCAFALSRYCYCQAFDNGYAPLPSFFTDAWLARLKTSLPAIFSFPLAALLYDAIDLAFGKKDKLTLIDCHPFRGDLIFPFKSFYLRAISNGKTYYFKITKKAFVTLRGERALKLDVIKGALGGLYVVKTPKPYNERMAKRYAAANRRSTILTFLLSCALAYYVFFR